METQQEQRLETFLEKAAKAEVCPPVTLKPGSVNYVEESREPEFFIKYCRVGLFKKRDRWTVCRRISDVERRKYQTDKIFFELEHFNDFKDADRVRNNCLKEW